MTNSFVTDKKTANASAINWSSLSLDEQQVTLARPAITNSASLSTQVAEILSLVKKQGDQFFVFNKKKYRCCARFW